MYSVSSDAQGRLEALARVTLSIAREVKSHELLPWAADCYTIGDKSDIQWSILEVEEGVVMFVVHDFLKPLAFQDLQGCTEL